MPKNIFYAQSGGMTAVINATACGVIETARRERRVGKVIAGFNGIVGALREELIDTSLESKKTISGLRSTPSAAFGSCRYKLKSIEESRAEYERLIAVFRAHDIGYFLYNGGGDSQDTAYKVSQISVEMGFPITCIGIPKTVDNDLPITDCCPGFGSVAKFVAISTLEAGLDVAAMSESSTKVFVLEVMGRHAGWIAASAGLAKAARNSSPHIILFPEIKFDQKKFLTKVKETVNRVGHCVVVASEGIQYNDETFVAETGIDDAFGHKQLGGVAPVLVDQIKREQGYKCHWSVADYLQRSARHIASATDVEQAYAVGKAAVEFAASGKNAVMPIILRRNEKPYRWSIGEVSLSKVANVERKIPRSFISKDGYSISSRCRQYLAPLIEGEDFPPYRNGLPSYARTENKLLKKKLPRFDVQ
ncbi:MAG: 6-phosphofructokinase [Candidatus Azotimanducaceae bacterium]|uniref:Pyrophosphate--fructose 6-phosphate 1-phosphotransferase n=1 Tax=OM182 bacterium TaxID=2510334 RepID=A0A520S3R3_9GAMM|nr:MAG: 6-phosphofructokinase [OM182 bacterium]